MIKTETKQKLEDSLANFIASGDISVLKWLIDIDTKNKTELFVSEKRLNCHSNTHQVT